MKDYSLSHQFALIALNGLEVCHPSKAKLAAVRGIAAAGLLETCGPLPAEGYEDGLAAFQVKLEAGLKKLEKMTKADYRQLEQEIQAALKADGVLEEAPDLLACDMNYDTAGIKLRSYRTDGSVYMGLVEHIRAEVLESGPVAGDIFFLIWLLRESGCLYDIFSSAEQVRLNERMVELTAEDTFYQIIWQKEFHNGLESLAGNFLRLKENLFKNPYLEGVNLMYPFLERRKAIFIDFVVLGSNVESRRMSVMAYLSERGHYVEEVAYSGETLLKIDNSYYRIFPKTKSCNGIPIQGANLVPVYL